MARYGQRPENALKRANEFIEVGKPARALDTLYEVFRNKKWAYNWSESVLEPIMFKYLDLCVDLKKSHIAKEGLFQYRNMFQSVNVSSLENVIRGYLRTAEERTESAREQSQQAVIDINIDDLDMIQTPESILLSAVSGEDAQDRSDRTILTPWVKFLWESYCQCLELLRTNAHVETLYHDIARMAFSFCLKYNRKTEFRKLCDKLRKHLEDISKLPAQTVNVSIHKAETQQLNLDTRLVQLDSAIQMELWQEAYKAIEDIHGLMNLSKKPPVPKTMANYYQKLAMVFWKAGNYLFHAAALFKLFQLSKDMKKNITSDETQRMACRVLLATLSIPLPSAHPEFDRFIETDKSPLEKAQRLAILLGLTQPPTRASLLRDIVRANVVTLASPNLQELYGWLEMEFNPLLLCERVNTVIAEIEASGEQPLQQYVVALQDVTLVRLVRQLAQIYQTLEFSRLLQLSKFATQFHLERLLVDCVRHNDMQIRIDHGSRCIHFGMDLSESQREDIPEGPTLQSMPSEQVRSQLVNMATVLHRAMTTIDPTKKRAEREKLREKMVQHYHDTKVREHQRILARHKIIEDRKEYLERMNTVREEEEARRQEDNARQQQAAETKRLEIEREERERKRQENEIQQIKDRHLKEKMQQISLTSHGQKILKKMDEEDIKKLDAEQIAVKETEELLKERKELQQKLKSQEKKVDYFERAKRLEEIPLLEKSFEEKAVADRKFGEQQEAERIQLLIKERELAVTHRERLMRMQEDKDAFVHRLTSERQSMYQDKVKEFERHLEEERKRRMAERKIQRREERRLQYLREKQEAEERKIKEAEERAEEEARKIKEAEEAAAEEVRKKREEEYQKTKEKLDQQAEIARQREEEAEKKRQSQESGSRGGGGASSWRRDGGAKEPERDVADGPKGGGRSEWRQGTQAATTAPAKAAAEPWRPSGGASSWRRGDADKEQAGDPDTDKLAAPEKTASADDKGPSPTFREKESGGGQDAWRSSRDDDSKDNRDSRGGYDRGAPRAAGGGYERRDDRGGGGYDRDRRGGGGGGYDRRDDRGGGGYERRDDRGGGGGGGGYERRDERGGGAFERRDDRGGGGGGYERRGGDDREQEKPTPSSWRRAAPAGNEDEDRRGGMRRDEQRSAPPPARAAAGGREGGSDWRSAKDSAPPMRRGEDSRRTDEVRRGGPPSGDKRPQEAEPKPRDEPLRENKPSRPAESAAEGEDADDDWQKVGPGRR